MSDKPEKHSKKPVELKADIAAIKSALKKSREQRAVKVSQSKLP